MPVAIKDESGYAALAPGTDYIDPTGTARVKPYVVRDEGSYNAVPDGAHYTDPSGTTRLKPSFEGVDYQAQGLYDLARNPNEQFNALARSYGQENVKQDGQGGFYVQKDGKYLKPGKGNQTRNILLKTAEGLAPGIGGAGGAIAGAGAGPVGSVAGGGLGFAMGQQFNDLILHIAGTYDRSTGENFKNTASDVLTGSAAEGGGEILGAGLGKLAPVVAAGVKGAKGLATNPIQAVKNLGQKVGPEFVGKYIGADKDPAATARAADLASKGVLVPPSAWMKEAPYLKSVVEEFDPAFRQQKVLRESAKDYYEKDAGNLLDTLGVKREPGSSLTDSSTKVSSKEAGDALMAHYQNVMKASDDALENAALQARQNAVTNNGVTLEAHNQAIEGLRMAADQNRAAAQQAVDAGFTTLQKAFQASVKTNPGDTMRQASSAILAVRKAVSNRARILYNAADAAAGGHQPDLGNLPQMAKNFMDAVPEDFASKYPDLVRRMKDLQTGDATFGQLHNLRSLLRSDVNYNDLTPSVKEGAYKFFSSKIDAVLHSVDAVPELQAASGLLKNADAFYANNIKRFNDEVVQGIISSTKAGMPPDANILARMVLKEGQTERIGEIKRLVGPAVWKDVLAADANAIFKASETLAPGEFDAAKFAAEVLSRKNQGILDTAYGPDAKLFTQQAQRVAMLEGGTNGKLLIQKLPGDTVASYLKRADDAMAQIKVLAEQDPMKHLGEELKRLDAEFSTQKSAVGAERSADPLHFLYEPSALAEASADRILRSPDLLRIAATKFGVDSPEFSLIRKTAAQRVLQRSLSSTGKMGDVLEKTMPEDVQKLLFPGESRNALLEIAKNMEFLNTAKLDAGGSIAAKTRVLHPWGSIVGPLDKLIPGATPGKDAFGRLLLSKYYSLVTWGATNPAFVQWVANGLKNPQSRETVKTVVQGLWRKAGGVLGVGLEGDEDRMEPDTNAQ